MKIELNTAAPRLVIGSGAEAFGVTLRKVTAAERMAALDALGRGFESGHHFLVRMIAAWDGLTDAAGNAVPFQPAGDGFQGNVEQVLYALPTAVYGELMAGMLTFMGLRKEAEHWQRLFAATTGAEAAALDPTTACAGDGRTPASAS